MCSVLYITHTTTVSPSRFPHLPDSIDKNRHTVINMDRTRIYAFSFLIVSLMYIDHTDSVRINPPRDEVYRPYTPEPLGAVEMTLPSFTNVYDHWHGEDTGPGPRSEKYSIIISSFNALPDTEDFIFLLKHPGQYLDDVQNSEVRTITQDVNCPREPRQIPCE